MSDSEGGPCQATPKTEIENRVMNVNIAKSETEWWAYNEISALRKGVEQIGEQWMKSQDLIEAQNVIIKEQAAELKRLRLSA